MSLCRWCENGETELVAYSAKARWFVEEPRSNDIGMFVVCRSCDLLYFDQPYSASELQLMYSGYRGPAYFKRRNRYEPWYTKKVNNAIGHSEEVLRVRHAHLQNLLQTAINDLEITSPERVLDIGGDEGQFIPDLPSIAKKAVLEVSGVKPLENVLTISSWLDAKSFRPNLIMLCHVLEHTDSAKQMIVDAHNALESNDLMYVEIPLDRPKKISKVFSSPRYAKYTKWLASHPHAFSFADFISLVTRRFFGQPILGSVIKQNEHINFYNEASLISVIESLGFTVVTRSRYKPSSGVPILDVAALGVLFKKI